VAGNETELKLAAMPDGGFVMAYGGFSTALRGFITVERFNSSGGLLSSRFIPDDRNSLTNWDITADRSGNYTVVFERETDDTLHTGTDVLSSNTHAITYDRLTNAPGAEKIGTAQNDREDDDRLGAIASLANGHVVTLTTEPDGGGLFEFPCDTVEFTITDSATGNRTYRPAEISGSADLGAVAENVAVLAGGQFVMLYRGEFSHNLFMRIGSAEAQASPIGSEIQFTTNDDFQYESPLVVGLKDGGFLDAWSNITHSTLFERASPLTARRSAQPSRSPRTWRGTARLSAACP
jgi:hypothetical protein